MKKANKSSRSVIKNPLIALVLSREEYEQLKRDAAWLGVSIAQIARGYFRIGIKNDKLQIEAVSRLGALEAHR